MQGLPWVAFQAIRLLASGRLKLQSLITDVLPITSVVEAMRLAATKDQALKVQLQLAPRES